MYPSTNGMETNSTFTPFAERVLAMPARGSLGLPETFFDDINRMGGERLWAAMSQAMEVGDQTTIRRIAGTYLQFPIHVPIGVSRDRLILSAAAAHADYVPVQRVKDLVPFLEAVQSEIALVRLNDATFGLRREGALENPFNAAEERMKSTLRLTRQLVGGNQNVTAFVVQGLAYLGDFPLSNAVAEAMNESAVSKEAPAVLSAQYRRLHKRPDLAFNFTSQFESDPIHPWTESSRCGALCDMGEFSAGLFHACRSLSLISLGDSEKEIKNRRFVGNTISRPLRALDYQKQFELAKEIISINAAGGSVPSGRTAGQQSAIDGAMILWSLGLPQLAEKLTKKIAVLPFDWVPEALNKINNTAVVARVAEADGRVRVLQVTA